VVGGKVGLVVAKFVQSWYYYSGATWVFFGYSYNCTLLNAPE
jgi:hypothetical protein